jgi:hypothetical protein
MLIRAEEECNDLKEFRAKFHATDKLAEVRAEKLKSNKINETLFGVGVGVGCAIIGLAPFFYELGPSFCYTMLSVGVALTIGATIGRIVFK